MDKCSECDNEANHSGLCDKHYLEMVGGSADEYKIQSLTDQIKAIPWAHWVKWVAHDENGMWNMFNAEPELRTSYWDNRDCRSSPVYDLALPTFPDWRESKVRVNE